jgi:hypothetical protein
MVHRWGTCREIKTSAHCDPLFAACIGKKRVERVSTTLQPWCLILLGYM